MQECSNELLAPLTQLLRIGLLRIRRAASEGDAALCMIEADHLHNLPALIEHFSDELLDFYLTVEWPAFLAQLERHVAASPNCRDVRQMEPLWAALERGAHDRRAAAAQARRGPQPAM